MRVEQKELAAVIARRGDAWPNLEYVTVPDVSTDILSLDMAGSLTGKFQ